MPTEDIDKFFRWKCFNGLKKLGLESPQYKERLEYELSVITKMGFPAYFLVVTDFLSWARNNGIYTGPGRGSVAGSLVAYALRITDIDPIKYDLYFERFLNPDRVSMPDIDLDFQDDRREEVIAYTTEKYKYVAGISTFGTMKCRGAVKAAARTLGADYATGDVLSKLTLPPVNGVAPKLAKCYEQVPQLDKYHNDISSIEGRVLRLADQVEDRIDKAGSHACFPYSAKLLTTDGYKWIGALAGQTVEILTRNGQREAMIEYAGEKDIGRLTWSKSKYSSIKNNIFLTDDHRVWSSDWVEAKQSVGLATNYQPIELPIEDVMCGWIWNDGHYTKPGQHYICFHRTRDTDAVNYFVSLLGYNHKNRPDRFSVAASFTNYISDNYGDGFKVINSVKQLPVFTSVIKKIAWLRGMLSANGTVQRGSIRLKLTSQVLCQFIKDELETLDIHSSELSKCKTIASIKGRKVNSKPAYQFEISANSTWKYANLIGFIQKYKIAKCSTAKFQSFNIVDTRVETYDFTVLSDNPEDQNGYVDGLLVHNSGFVIGDRPLHEIVPLVIRKEILCSEWDMNEIEKIGLIKFDFLGLTALTVISKTIDLIKKRHGITVDLSTIPDYDQQVFAQLQAGDNIGVFQIETSSGMRDLMVKMKPISIQDLGMLVAIWRPGPLQASYLQHWLKVRSGEASPEYVSPLLEPILSETGGFLIYQESCMKMAVQLAGYTAAESDLLRKAIGKKLPEEMAKQETKFKSGLLKSGLTQVQTDKLWDDIRGFAAYSFNKAHSIAYGLIAYQTAWLKTHYTVEFMCALLTCNQGNTDQVLKYIFDCRSHGIKVLPPDVNISESGFSIDESGSIRFGLAAVKNLGEDIVSAMIDARGSIPFVNLSDFISRVDLSKVNKRKLESLVLAGAFDFSGYTRSSMVDIIEQSIDYRHEQKAWESKVKTYNKKIEAWRARNEEIKHCEISGTKTKLKPFKEPKRPEELKKPSIRTLPELAEKDLLAHEKELLGFYVSGHPVERYAKFIASASNFSSIEKIKTTGDNGDIVSFVAIPTSIEERTTKSSGKKMASMIVEDLTANCGATCFPKTWEQYSALLRSNEPLLFNCKISVQDAGDTATITELFIQQVSSLKFVGTNALSKLDIHVPADLTIVEQVNELINKYTGTETKLTVQLVTKAGLKINIPHVKSIRSADAFNKELQTLIERDGMN